jgi:FkbM family methyltransferase
MKQLLKNLGRSVGFRFERWRPANRFNEMADTLAMLRDSAYRPRVIIDGGANVGHWARMALRVFPDAALHLIEPQTVCRPALERLARARASTTFHPVALSEPGRTRLAFTGGATDGGTGVHVLVATEVDVELECDATTLDALFGGRVDRADRTLLKLDLEGHELPALRGAAALLPDVEVVVVEAQVYDANDNGLPVFRDVFDLLCGRGFELYDFASLTARPRDLRLRMLDAVFVRADSALAADRSWE